MQEWQTLPCRNGRKAQKKQHSTHKRNNIQVPKEMPDEAWILHVQRTRDSMEKSKQRFCNILVRIEDWFEPLSVTFTFIIYRREREREPRDNYQLVCNYSLQVLAENDLNASSTANHWLSSCITIWDILTSTLYKSYYYKETNCTLALFSQEKVKYKPL